MEGAIGHRMDEYQFHHQGHPVDETRHGRKMMLKDYSIKNGSTLVLTKIGLKLEVTNPTVKLGLLVQHPQTKLNFITIG